MATYEPKYPRARSGRSSGAVCDRRRILRTVGIRRSASIRRHSGIDAHRIRLHRPRYIYNKAFDAAGCWSVAKAAQTHAIIYKVQKWSLEWEYARELR